MQFNGDEWLLLPLNNESDVRSLWPSPKHKRIYVGGESEFGYFEPDKNGALVYTKQSDKFNEKHNLYGGYWGVFEVDNLLYYVSDWYIIKQLEGEFTPISSSSKIDCSALVNGVLYIGTGKGVKMLIGNTLLSLPNGEILTGKTIRSIVSYRNGILIATAFDGLFYASNNQVIAYPTGAETFMRENEIFSMAVSGNYIAIGTIHKGLLLLNTETGENSFYNESNGLQNNTVLSIGFDNHENIWLGLDNGIDYIPLCQPYTNLYTSPNSKGTGYSTLLKDKKLYLGTNRGLYYTPYPVLFDDTTPDFGLITELSGQVWDLQEVGEDIFCLHDKGLYIIHPDQKISVISGIRGAISGTPDPADPDKYWIGTYGGLHLIERKEGKWSLRHRIEGLNEWMKNFAFDKNGTLWIRVLNYGVHRIELDTLSYAIQSRYTLTEEDGFPSVRNLNIHSIDGELYFTCAAGLYEYDSLHNKIIRSEKGHEILAVNKTPHKIQQINDHLIVLYDNMIKIINRSEEAFTESRVYPFSRQQIDFIPHYEQMYILSDSLIIIPNERGFALLDTKFTFKESHSRLLINQVYLTYPHDSLLYKDNFLYSIQAEEPEIAYSKNGIRFEYGWTSIANGEAAPYSYRLLPDTAWSQLTQAKVKEYTNLREGKYTFEVKVIDTDGTPLHSSYSFTILPPWYRTIYAWLTYTFIFFCLVGVLYKLEEKRLARKRQLALEKKDLEMKEKEEEFKRETIRQEQQIIELKNEKLEQELNHKSQEMANLMIHLSRKNEILNTIKQELYKVIGEMRKEENVKPKRMLLTLNSRIDLNMESDDVLKRFEEEFDIVHNNFIKKLTEKHPDLSIGERKMCAYLKMNLSSKEIAPLLNLSVRGVETLRYRLRKKLGLGREDSLIEYLNTFAHSHDILVD